MPKAPPMGIAKGLHIESVVKELISDVNFVKERSLQHSARIHELFSLLEGTATKAEIHAAVAGLSYRNMSSALPAEYLSGMIGSKFHGQIAEEDHTPQSLLRQPAELTGYLSNPHDALVAMSERIKRLEKVQNKERKIEASGDSKVHKEITSLLKKSDQSESQVSALQSEVYHLSGLVKKLQHQNQHLVDKVRLQEEHITAAQSEFSLHSSRREMQPPPSTPPPDKLGEGLPLTPTPTTGVGEAAVSRQQSQDDESECEPLYHLDALSGLPEQTVSLVVNEGSQMEDGAADSAITVDETRFGFSAVPDDPVVFGASVEEGKENAKTVGGEERRTQQPSSVPVPPEPPTFAPVMLDQIDMTQHPPPSSSVPVVSKTPESHPQRRDVSLPPHRDPPPPGSPAVPALSSSGNDPTLDEGSLQIASVKPVGAPHTPSRMRQQALFRRSSSMPVPSPPSETSLPDAAPSVDDAGPSTPERGVSMTMASRPPIVGAQSSTSPTTPLRGVAIKYEAFQQQIQQQLQQHLQQQQENLELQQQRQLAHTEQYLSKMKVSVAEEVTSRCEKSFGDRIRALESHMVQISTLTEAVMVLSQEHRALTEAHKKIEADEKAYQDAYLTGIESISKVVEKCFTKVEEFSTESTALSTQNILTIEGNVDSLQKLVQNLQEKFEEVSFALKVMPMSMAPRGPAPPADMSLLEDSAGIMLPSSSTATATAPPENADGGDADGERESQERASRDAAAHRATLLKQQQINSVSSSEELRSVIAEMYKLSVAVTEVKQHCERLDKASAQPVTSISVRGGGGRNSSVANSRAGSVTASRPPPGRPRNSSTLTSHRTYSTSLATEAAKQATDEIIQASKMRSMHNEMAALKEEMDRVRTVAMNSIYIAQQSSHSDKAVSNQSRGNALTKEKGQRKSVRPVTATFEHNLRSSAKKTMQLRATSAPIGESPRKASSLNATMDRVRRCLENEALEERSGILPVEIDLPVRGEGGGVTEGTSSHSPQRNNTSTSKWSRDTTRSPSQRKHHLDSSSVEILDELPSVVGFGDDMMGSTTSIGENVGEGSSGGMMWGAGGPNEEFNVSYYLSSVPHSPVQGELGGGGGDRLNRSSSGEQKDAWFRYSEEPTHSTLAPSVNRVRTVSPPQVRPERKRAQTAGGKFVSDHAGSTSIGSGLEGEGSLLYKGEWSMSLSLAKPNDSTCSNDTLQKSSLLEISGSSVSKI